MIEQPEARFTLAELVDASGVPERTIRYYIVEELVPPALGRGRSRYFTTEHLQQLEYVKSLREQKYSIDEIREMLQRDAGPAEDEPPPEMWERYVLHDGLELLLRSDAPEGVRALSRELREAARSWFGDESG